MTNLDIPEDLVVGWVGIVGRSTLMFYSLHPKWITGFGPALLSKRPLANGLWAADGQGNVNAFGCDVDRAFNLSID